MKKGKLLFKDMIDSDSESEEEEYDDCSFDEVARIIDNQFQQATAIFENELSKHKHSTLKSLKKDLKNDLSLLQMDMFDEQFVKKVRLDEFGVRELEEKLKNLENKKKEMNQRKTYYETKLNKLKRRRVDTANAYVLPESKIVKQLDSIGSMRKYYSQPDLRSLDANLKLLNGKQRNRKFISNILFVQEYIVDRGFLLSNLANSINKDKQYFFNKFEKTISSTVEYNFFKAKTNHFSIDYNKFKNKGRIGIRE
jgi:predicted S18 family serine protease